VGEAVQDSAGNGSEPIIKISPACDSTG
jgi:hypothetical protein